MLLLLACTFAPVDDTAGIAVDPPESVELNDKDGGVEIAVSGGSAPGWLLGAVLPERGFTSEGCLEDDDVCHALGASGGFVTIDPDAEPADGTTVIPVEDYRAGDMTFVLKPSIGSGCWTWGAEPIYYVSLGCSTEDWSNESY